MKCGSFCLIFCHLKITKLATQSFNHSEKHTHTSMRWRERRIVVIFLKIHAHHLHDDDLLPRIQYPYAYVLCIGNYDACIKKPLRSKHRREAFKNSNLISWRLPHLFWYFHGNKKLRYTYEIEDCFHTKQNKPNPIELRFHFKTPTGSLQFTKIQNIRFQTMFRNKCNQSDQTQNRDFKTYGNGYDWNQMIGFNHFVNMISVIAIV